MYILTDTMCGMCGYQKEWEWSSAGQISFLGCQQELSQHKCGVCVCVCVCVLDSVFLCHPGWSAVMIIAHCILKILSSSDPPI